MICRLLLTLVSNDIIILLHVFFKNDNIITIFFKKWTGSGNVGSEIDVDALGKMALSHGTTTYTTRTIYKPPMLVCVTIFMLFCI